MLYFSELKGKKVVTEDRIYVGKLVDLIFLVTENPLITKIVLNSPKKEKLIVPVGYLIKFNGEIILSKNYRTLDLTENELYVDINVVDKQIIDIKGSKIVRVNDIAIQEKPSLYIAGVDIGILGILRWLKLERLMVNLLKMFGQSLSPNFLSWADIQPLELAHGRVMLKKEEDKLEKIRPEDLADYLEKTNIKNVTKILNILDEDFAAEVIGNLNVNYQTTLFRYFSPQKATKLISLIDPDEAVDILFTINRKKREQIISLLDEEKRKKIEYLLDLSKTPIGGLITSEYIEVDSELTVKKVIDLIKTETTDFSFLDYIYVINKNKQLIGVFNLHEMILQKLDTQVYKFMRPDVVVVHLTTPEEIAIKKLLKYRLNALPIIDRDKKMVGVIALDDIAEHILEKYK